MTERNLRTERIPQHSKRCEDILQLNAGPLHLAIIVPMASLIYHAKDPLPCGADPSEAMTYGSMQAIELNACKYNTDGLYFTTGQLQHK